MNRIQLAVLALCSLITAQGAVFQYAISLDGASESPVNTSPGIGAGIVNYDDGNHTLQLAVSFTSLEGTVTAAHIHAPTAAPFSGTAGVATTTPTFPGFPTGVSFGAYATTLDLTSASSFNPSYVTANGGTPAGAEAALATAVANGQAYLNIHSSSFPGGEIRGFLKPIPEPRTLALFGLGTLGMAIYAGAKRRAGKR